MTDEQGVFKIVTDISDGLFKVTSVGYQTLYIKAGNDLTIQMKEDAKLLSEVVVKSRSFIGGVGRHAKHTTDPKAPTLHIVADNFLGGVDVKN